MESMAWFMPVAEGLFIGAIVFTMFFYFISTSQVPVKWIRVECPETRLPFKVLMKINIFKAPQKIGKGLDVVSCSHFSGEEVICSKKCLFTEKAQQAHQIAGRRHIEKNSILALNK